jgi:hypothetical protein
MKFFKNFLVKNKKITTKIIKMKIENYEKAGKYRLYFPLLFVASATLIIYSVAVFDKLKSVWLGIGVVLYLIYLFLILKKPYYINFEVKHTSIVVRFFNPHPFLSKPKAYNIRINDFAGYEIVEKLGGLNKFIVFKIKKGKQIGAYPPLSVSLLTKDQIENIKKELDTILKIKKLK